MPVPPLKCTSYTVHLNGCSFLPVYLLLSNCGWQLQRCLLCVQFGWLHLFTSAIGNRQSAYPVGVTCPGNSYHRDMPALQLANHPLRIAQNSIFCSTTLIVRILYSLDVSTCLPRRLVIGIGVTPSRCGLPW